MCMTYFMGAAAAIRLVPWDPEHRDLHVGPLSDAEAQAADHFDEAEVVHYLGSHLQCGCGFRCETLGEEPEEAEEKQRVHERLAEYLTALPDEARPVQIYGCWTDDLERPAEHLREVSVDRIRDPDFQFRERELLTVRFPESRPTDGPAS